MNYIEDYVVCMDCRQMYVPTYSSAERPKSIKINTQIAREWVVKAYQNLSV